MVVDKKEFTSNLGTGGGSKLTRWDVLIVA
jgi:hypothetical protein